MDAEYLMQMAMPSKSSICSLFALGISSDSAANDGCPQSGAEIATDPPDVTNSSSWYQQAACKTRTA
jgi:hypothetical protein